jgi:ABC-type multidrug transport system permease subunit
MNRLPWAWLRGTWRVFRQDLIQLVMGFYGILLVFILPSLMLGLVGQLSVQGPPFEVSVYGAPDPDDPEVYDKFVALLEDISTVELDTRPEATLDPLNELRDGGLDLLINLEGEESREWVMYTAADSRRTLASVQQLAAGLERALRVIDSLVARSNPDEVETLAEETLEWGTQVGALGSFTPRQLLAYYPIALDRTTDIVAGTLVLIICFLPFVLAAPLFIREQEAHTLEVLLAAPGIDGRGVLVGKWLFVVVVCMAELLLLMVLIQSVYGIQIKPGFMGIFGLFLPAVMATALLGLAVSALARAQAQVGMASALYFLAITLLTGFLLPLEASSVLIRGLSLLFPLTAVFPVFKSWAVGADPGGAYASALGLLLAQCVAYGALALGALRYAIRRM